SSNARTVTRRRAVDGRAKPGKAEALWSWERDALIRKPRQKPLHRHVLPCPRPTVFDLDRAGGDAAGADDGLVRKADQVHRGEFGAGRFIAVVVEHLDPGIA